METTIQSMCGLGLAWPGAFPLAASDTLCEQIQAEFITDGALPVADVAFENAPVATSGGGMLSYLHKVKDGVDLYYFANSSDDRVGGHDAP